MKLPIADFTDALAGERTATGEQIPQRRAEAEDVGAGIERTARDLLRAGVGGRAEKAALRERRLRLRRRSHRLGQSEIDHLHEHGTVRTMAPRSGFRRDQHQIARFEIAMNQALFVRRHQRAGDLHGDVDDHGGGERSVALHALREGFALDEFHRVETLAGRRLAEMKNAGDVGMAQLRRRARLAAEALAHFRRAGKHRVDHLQRDGRVEIHVARLVGDAHGAAAKLEQRHAVGLQANLVVLEATDVVGRRLRRLRIAAQSLAGFARCWLGSRRLHSASQLDTHGGRTASAGRSVRPRRGRSRRIGGQFLSRPRTRTW